MRKELGKELGKEGLGKSDLGRASDRVAAATATAAAAADAAAVSGSALRAVPGVPLGNVGAWLGRLRLGRAKECGGVVLVPLLVSLVEPRIHRSVSPELGRSGEEGRQAMARAGVGNVAGCVAGRDYRPMPEAMARGELMVMEVSPEGVVGELLVVNRGTLPVLALEGEEWSGARQNRVLTESVLLRPGAAVRVPVVCSEPGRWSYRGRGVGPAMGDSGVCLPLGLRAAMRRAGHGVGHGVGDRAQEVVRRGLMEWRYRLAMGGTMAEWQERDVRRWEGLEEAFAWVPGQVGWLACVHGCWQAVEAVSRPSAWRRWHGKRLRSVLAGAEPRGIPLGRHAPGTETGWREEALAVLGELAGGAGLRRPGVDMGEIQEWETSASRWVGAALVEGGDVLHAGWYRVGLDEPGAARRRGPGERGHGAGITSVPR